MLLAALNQARYKIDNSVVEIAEGRLMTPENLQSFNNLLPNVNFDGYFNRDSLKYIDVYGIPEAQTVIRGTLRYKVLIPRIYVCLSGGYISHECSRHVGGLRYVIPFPGNFQGPICFTIFNACSMNMYKSAKKNCFP